MRVLCFQSAGLLLIGASPALAAFEQFYFAGNGGNATAPRKCGDMIYECPAPSMCSRDTLTQKWYCCESGNQVGPCWTGATKCEGSSTDKPSQQQTGCTNLGVDYCCHEAEQCTQNAKQFRVCWSKQPNTIRYLNSTSLNETYSSLSSASPKATSFSIDAQRLFALTSTTPGASSARPTLTPSASSASASTSASTTSSPPPTPPNTSSNSLSGGAIGGIVGGVLGGFVLLGALAFFLWRRRKTASKNSIDPHAPPSTEPYQGYGYQPGYQPPPQQSLHEANSPYSPQPAMAQLDSPPLPSTKYAQMQGPVEVPATNGPAEMDAGYASQVRNGK